MAEASTKSVTIPLWTEQDGIAHYATFRVKWRTFCARNGYLWAMRPTAADIEGDVPPRGDAAGNAAERAEATVFEDFVRRTGLDDSSKFSRQKVILWGLLDRIGRIVRNHWTRVALRNLHRTSEH